MDASLQAIVEGSENESAQLDFKALFDPASAKYWCELVKDIVAMANSNGGVIVFGVNDDGTPGSADLTDVLSIDPASIVDKIKKYTGQHSSMRVLLWRVEHGEGTKWQLCPSLSCQCRWFSPLPARTT
jgi:predicted HTH transcriptional regulator